MPHEVEGDHQGGRSPSEVDWCLGSGSLPEVSHHEFGDSSLKVEKPEVE